MPRTDDYGGSVQNRLRFLTEGRKAVSDEIGSHNSRCKAWTTYQAWRHG
nr:hypothetical protein [Pseudoalteromonas sp. S1691]